MNAVTQTAKSHLAQIEQDSATVDPDAVFSRAELLDAAIAEGLEANTLRMLRFLGWTPGEWQEVQALDVPGAGNMTAFAKDEPAIIKLLVEMDRRKPMGSYVILNRAKPGVESRYTPNRWHSQKKGSSTVDKDIAARRVLYVDFDRGDADPKKTSALEHHVVAALVRAECLYEDFARQLGGTDPLALGMSGNGAFVMVALDDLPNSTETENAVKLTLACIAALYGTDEIKIDVSVCDAKRLGPAAGTIKRKGAEGHPERPHRRTGILCNEKVRRIGFAGLVAIAESLSSRLSEEQHAQVRAAMGIKPAKKSKDESPELSDDPFKRANACDISDVAKRLGIELDKCPGCESESGIAIVGNGFKCSHNSCAQKGFGKGFRTPVDLVAEVKGIKPWDAVLWLADEFGFKVERHAHRESADRGAAREAGATVLYGQLENGKPNLSPESTNGGENSAVPIFMSAETITVKPVRWLWRGRIARGTIAMLDGDPGLGKSTLLADLTARVTRGEPLPGDACGDQPANVIIISYEDSPECVIVPRLMAAKADLSRVKLWNLDAHPFVLPDNLGELVSAVEQAKPALVIVDPGIAAFSTAVNTHRDQDVRRVLSDISALANRTDAAFLLVRHLNKNTGGSALYRGGGSIALIAASRTGMILGEDPDDKEAGRILAVTKCNLGRHGATMKLKLTPAPSPAPGIEVARVVWGEVSNMRADELVEDKEDRTQSSKASELIRQALASGRVLAKEVQATLRANGISERTEYRVRDKIGVIAERESPNSGPWFLRLPL